MVNFNTLKLTTLLPLRTSITTYFLYFTEKVEGLLADTDNSPPPSYTRYDGPQLRNFREVSIEDVR